jgi:hypothetical protein
MHGLAAVGSISEKTCVCCVMPQHPRRRRRLQRQLHPPVPVERPRDDTSSDVDEASVPGVLGEKGAKASGPANLPTYAVRGDFFRKACGAVNNRVTSSSRPECR